MAECQFAYQIGRQQQQRLFKQIGKHLEIHLVEADVRIHCVVRIFIHFFVFSFLLQMQQECAACATSGKRRMYSLLNNIVFDRDGAKIELHHRALRFYRTLAIGITSDCRCRINQIGEYHNYQFNFIEF